jgi:hypothetical protein
MFRFVAALLHEATGVSVCYSNGNTDICNNRSQMSQFTTIALPLGENSALANDIEAEDHLIM